MTPSSKNRLMPRHEALFPGETLFERIARAVCRAGVLPRKELYEAWEMARRVRRRYRGGRVVDMACGHGLLALVMMILDKGSCEALAVDTRIPKSAAPLFDSLCRTWPFLARRVTYEARDIRTLTLAPEDLVVSAHACGSLTDEILSLATVSGARVAVLPCCHDLDTCDSGNLSAWMDGALAVDAVRALTLRSRGYRIHTACIPGDITPKNRLLMGAPESRPAPMPRR